MPSPHVRSSQGVPEPIRPGFERLRAELDIPDGFPPDVVAEAERAAASVVLPSVDATGIPLITIDPEGSTDLDQAVHLERDGDGYVVWYAIADVASFVVPGGPVDLEARRRGLTLYAPRARVPLHPEVLSEGAASLLPDQVRPALLWEHRLDAAGDAVSSKVSRARVRSRHQWTYAGVQAALDDQTASEPLLLLREVGLLREKLERARGGVSLPIPEQEIDVTDAGDWVLSFRSPLPVEGWNAQISLLTGMAAASIMLDAGLGILRTLPPAAASGIARLRRVARALRVPWTRELSYPEFVRSLDPSLPNHLAMLTACTSLFRGAGYAMIDGAPPAQPLHGAMNVAYAHATAPLRRLVDRYVGEICVAACAGEPVPGWVREALPELPSEMGRATQRANRHERGVLELVEALVLSTHVGDAFAGTVVSWDDEAGRGEVQLTAPAVSGRLVGGRPEVGAELLVRVTEADMLTGRIEFAPA